jgi:hypothetical protein
MTEMGYEMTPTKVFRTALVTLTVSLMGNQSQLHCPTLNLSHFLRRSVTDW